MNSRKSQWASLGAAVVFVVGCSQSPEQKAAEELPPAAAAAEPATPEPPPAAPEPEPAPPSAEENIQTIEAAYAAAFVDGRIDTSKAAQYFAPGAVFHDMPAGQQDLAAWKANIAAINAAFSEISAERLGPWAEGDLVATHVTLKLKSTGEYNGAGPTGEVVTVRGIELARLQQGKIVDRWATFDRYGLMQQLGAIEGAPVFTEGEAPRKDTAPDPEANRKLVADFLTSSAWTSGTPEALDAAFAAAIAEDALFHSMPADAQGAAGFRKAATTFIEASSERSPEVLAILADGDLVIAHWQNSMKHTGELLGRKATGMPVTLRGTDIYRVAEGKVVENWQYLDMLGLQMQLDAHIQAAKAPADAPTAAAQEVAEQATAQAVEKAVEQAAAAKAAPPAAAAKAAPATKE